MTSSEAPLDAESLRSALARRPGAGAIGSAIEYHPSLGSTNDRARKLADAGAAEGCVVVAGEQTRGRGRNGRTWHSAPGLGLYLSVLLMPAGRMLSQAPILGLMAAVAGAESLSGICGAAVGIKWPNDLIALEGTGRRRKLGGILSEARGAAGALRDVIIGIGVNVGHRESDFPEEIVERAGSIRMLRGSTVPPLHVALAMLAALDDWYTLWSREGSDRVLDRYRALAPDLSGRRVRVADGGAPWTGITDGVTSEGALRIMPETAGGAGEPGPAAQIVRYGEIHRLEEA
ncbi:MAG TPA: biotin--[acetyl-CoA-carboxylase] ligase [Candidatus Polarisedimenticolia bacterium]|nr:biotin--[acetyl-CoA-carboxylase] ligase [Candidatus Polarisedimenticolia bacterium]